MIKPRYIAYIASSIDGVIALDKNKLPDWTSKEDQQFFQNSLKNSDAFVMGRNTFEATKKLPRRENTFVLTGQIKAIKREGKITFINPKGANLKSLLSKFKEIAVLGGGKTYQYMLDKGMIDEIFLTIEPIVLGPGVGMFGAGMKNAKLVLVSNNKLNNSSTILLHYRVDKAVNSATVWCLD